MPTPHSSVVAGVVGVWTILALGVGSLSAQVVGVVVEAPKSGQMVPELVTPYATATGVATESYVLARELGRVVVLVFCPRLDGGACGDLWRSWAPAGPFGGEVSLVAVTAESGEAQAAAAKALGVEVRVLTDARGVESRRWGVGGGSRGGRIGVYVVGREGRVVYRDLQYQHSDAKARDRLLAAVTTAVGSIGGN